VYILYVVTILAIGLQ